MITLTEKAVNFSNAVKADLLSGLFVICEAELVNIIFRFC